MECDDKIFDSLPMFESAADLPSSNLFSQLQYFVKKIFCLTIIYNNVNELRWFIYSNCSIMEEDLPLTYNSLPFHIQSTHHVLVIWKKANENHPYLPSPTDLVLIQRISIHFCILMLCFS